MRPGGHGKALSSSSSGDLSDTSHEHHHEEEHPRHPKQLRPRPVTARWLVRLKSKKKAMVTEVRIGWRREEREVETLVRKYLLRMNQGLYT